MVLVDVMEVVNPVLGVGNVARAGKVVGMGAVTATADDLFCHDGVYSTASARKFCINTADQMKVTTSLLTGTSIRRLSSFLRKQTYGTPQLYIYIFNCFVYNSTQYIRRAHLLLTWRTRHFV